MSQEEEKEWIKDMNRGGKHQRTTPPEQCYCCGKEFVGPMVQWQAAITVDSAEADKQNLTAWRWVSVCGDCYWKKPAYGKRPGVRKRVPNEYITKWSNYASY